MTTIMWATKADHLLGDLSRPDGGYCFVSSQDDTHFIGSWCDGIGYFKVAFPKETTRALTLTEMEWFVSHEIVISSEFKTKH